MLYDSVMRNIQNRHKRIKHMNSFINARLQRKLRKFSNNLLSGSKVWVPTFWLPTNIHKTLETNFSFHVKLRTAEKVQFASTDKIFILAAGLSTRLSFYDFWS